MRLIRDFLKRAALQANALPLVGHVPGVNPGGLHRDAKIERFSDLLEHATRVATDPAIHFAFIHLPIPHPPGIYNRDARRLTFTGRADYLDSVVLADVTLGMLRRALETAGEWDGAVVLVTSDHGWRTSLWRGGHDWTAEEASMPVGHPTSVPFLLKLPGQKTAVTDSEAFNTVISRRLVAQILDGHIADSAQIGAAVRSLQ